MELSDSGKAQKRYICGNDLVYADREEGTEKQYYVKNPHGDVLQLTDAIYLRARYYQPYLGRFLTRDTYTGDEEDSLSLHLYTYCGNDGGNRVDPSG